VISSFSGKRFTKITKVNLAHTCNLGAVSRPRIASNFLATEFEGGVMDNGAPRCQPLINQLRREQGVIAKYSNGWKGLQKAIAAKEGDLDGSFKGISDYLRKTAEANPGSRVVFEKVDGNFSRCFIGLEGCRLGLEWCIPIISLDACAIKNKYHGVIMGATALDGERNMVPLAFAICPIENTENWSWFLTQLRGFFSALSENPSNIAIMSDREKGLEVALLTILPHCITYYCAKHLEKNLKSQFSCNFGEHFWTAAKTLNQNKFAEMMSEMEAINEPAHAYLARIPAPKWARVFAPLPKFKQTTSNTAESFNSWLGNTRDLSHFRIISSLIEKIALHFFERKTRLMEMGGELVPAIRDEWERHSSEGRRMDCIQYATSEFVIKTTTTPQEEHIVNLDAKRCSCNFFHDMQRPCAHAACAIVRGGRDIREFFSLIYFVESLRNLYAGNFRLVSPTLSMLELDGTGAPLARRMPGRPKKLRLRNRSELVSENSPISCGRCGLTGHNRRTCERRSRGERVERQ